MDYQTILFDVSDRVATITLNRPERMNAWNGRMAFELGHCLKQCDESDDVRAVVLTGAGRAFCAGADMSAGEKTFSAPESDEEVEVERMDSPARIFPWSLSKPVLAAINGHAIGVGITYPMMCDMRWVAEDAKLQFAFVRRGVIPELASHTILARVVGFSNAADLLFSGRVFTGREAAELGIATAALPADQVLPAALERAREIAVHAAPVSVAISKKLLWEGIAKSVPEMLRREARLFAWTSRQPDAREGVMAFLEKREPDWKLSVPKDRPDLLDEER